MSGESMEQVYASLNGCQRALSELGQGCCVDGRRSTIKALAAEIAAHLDNGARSADELQLESEVERLSEWGATLGRLNVTCCTETRAPLYRQAFDHLRTAYERLMVAAGIGH